MSAVVENKRVGAALREKGLQAKPCKTSGSNEPPAGIQKPSGLVLERTSSRRRLIRGFAAHHQLRICSPRCYPLSLSRLPPDQGFGRPLRVRGDDNLAPQPEPLQAGDSPSLASPPSTGVFGRPIRKRKKMVDGRDCADEGKPEHERVQLPPPIAKLGSKAGGKQDNTYSKYGMHFPEYILKALKSPLHSEKGSRRCT